MNQSQHILCLKERSWEIELIKIHPSNCHAVCKNRLDDLLSLHVGASSYRAEAHIAGPTASLGAYSVSTEKWGPHRPLVRQRVIRSNSSSSNGTKPLRSQVAKHHFLLHAGKQYINLFMPASAQRASSAAWIDTAATRIHISVDLSPYSRRYMPLNLRHVTACSFSWCGQAEYESGHMQMPTSRQNDPPRSLLEGYRYFSGIEHKRS